MSERTDAVKIAAKGRGAEVAVNGADISRVVASYHVRHSSGGVPTVELELIGAHQFEGPARVEIQPKLRAALIALGWTAPDSSSAGVLQDRERELLEIKGPCSNAACRLHYAHSGPCDGRIDVPHVVRSARQPVCAWRGEAVDRRNGRTEPGDPPACGKPIEHAGKWLHSDGTNEHPVRFGGSA